MIDFDAVEEAWDSRPDARERARSVAEEIRKKVPLDRCISAMEYGCGAGLLGLHLHGDVERLTMADSSKEMLESLKEKIRMSGLSNVRDALLDLTRDTPPEEKYDLIVVSMVLHHIEQIDPVLQSFHVLLHAGGYLCIADLDSEDGSFHGISFAGHRGFDRESLKRRLLHIGFSDLDVTTCYTMKKRIDDGNEKEFPLFLLVGKKSA